MRKKKPPTLVREEIDPGDARADARNVIPKDLSNITILIEKKFFLR